MQEKSEQYEHDRHQVSAGFVMRLGMFAQFLELTMIGLSLTAPFFSAGLSSNGQHLVVFRVVTVRTSTTEPNQSDHRGARDGTEVWTIHVQLPQVYSNS